MRSREENISVQISNLLSDIRTDPERIGFYLAHTPDPQIYDRLEELFESTTMNRQERQERIKKMILGLDLEG